MFFDILAEEMARRDLDDSVSMPEENEALSAKMEAYLDEFELNGIDNLVLDN